MFEKRKRKRGFEAKKSLYGFCFIIPWIIGILALFIIPLFKSLWYSFCDVGFADTGGIKTDFLFLENYQYIFRTDPDFFDNLKSSISSFLFSFPIIIILSLIFALIINQKFHGRLFVRAIFFLPVIIATGVVMQNLSSAVSGQPAMQDIGSSGGYSVSAVNFEVILSGLGFPVSVVEILSKYMGMIFDLIWNTGIQVILFVSGMQTIPDQLYEVSKIEGATKWEEFWFVTIPMLRNITLLVMLFTMVDLFITIDSPVVTQAYNLINSLSYGMSSAMLWAYIMIVGILSGIILLLYNKLCIKRWE